VTRILPNLRPALLAAALCHPLFSQQPTEPQPEGFWHTQGNQIVDDGLRPVRIEGVSWYGFETRDHVPHGLEQQDYHTILYSICNLGFNVVRLPFSNEAIESNTIPTKIGFANRKGKINQDLRHLRTLQVMDQIIDAAGDLGLRVILDNHRSDAGDGPQPSGLWYTSRFPESRWITDWQMLARRYKSRLNKEGEPIVIGVDLRNEPHTVGSIGGACWTGDQARGGCPTSNTTENWTSAAIRAGNAILVENPGLLIFVEGTDRYESDCTFWGSNLEGVRNSKVVLILPNRVVYSAHDYGPSEYHHPWFNSDTTPLTLANTWMKYWGFLIADNAAPVWIGEFGTGPEPSDAVDQSPGCQGQWFTSLTEFLAAHPAIHWSYWALNGEDRYGLLKQDYSAILDSGSPRDQALADLVAH
jgi:endoglucanase